MCIRDSFWIQINLRPFTGPCGLPPHAGQARELHGFQHSRAPAFRSGSAHSCKSWSCFTGNKGTKATQHPLLPATQPLHPCNAQTQRLGAQHETDASSGQTEELRLQPPVVATLRPLLLTTQPLHLCSAQTQRLGVQHETDASSGETEELRI